MLPYLDRQIPIVFLYNNIESFFEFLHRTETAELPRHQYVANRQYSKGDRGLLSLREDKLVFVSAPVPHAAYLRDHLGYRNTRFAYPANPSPWLSLDILQEPPLLYLIADYAGPERTVQLVPYATTPQFMLLVRALRSHLGLTVLLPECPLPDCEWVKEYIDTKAGYRSLVSRWLAEAEALMPEGIACESMLQAAEVARWFSARGKPCVIKTDGGESGMGQHIVRPAEARPVEAIFQELQADPYLHHDLIIVEEYIDSTNHLSPSLEVYVPPAGDGEPRITYLSNQLFLGVSDFYGLLISKEQTQTKWYPPLAESGLIIARKLQAMGYAGHFDIDTVVDDNDRVYLLELNSRRTAGTHVHEFARHFFGENYLDEVALLSINKMKTGHINRFEDLSAAVSDMVYPMAGQKRGLIFAVTSIIAAGEFGCIIVGASAAEALDLHQQLRDRFQPATH